MTEGTASRQQDAAEAAASPITCQQHNHPRYSAATTAAAAMTSADKVCAWSSVSLHQSRSPHVLCQLMAWLTSMR